MAVLWAGSLLSVPAAVAAPAVSPSPACIDRYDYLAGLTAWDLPGLPIHLTGDARLCTGPEVPGPSQPVVAFAAVPKGTEGYWWLGDGGEVTWLGGALRFGELDLVPSSPFVDIAATPTGRGYWLAAADGGVFAFGDARFFGSLGGVGLRQSVGIGS